VQNHKQNKENPKIPLLASEFPPLQRGIMGDLSSLVVTPNFEYCLLVAILSIIWIL